MLKTIKQAISDLRFFRARAVAKRTVLYQDHLQGRVRGLPTRIP